jgi:hypothetical protein
MQAVAGCASAEAVNDAGQISGIATDLNATICGAADFGLTGAATAINSTGQTVGFSGQSAFLFPSTNLGPTVATGINDNDWVVGYQVTPLQGNARVVLPAMPTNSHIARLRPHIIGTSKAWIWSAASGIVMLPNLLFATAINQSGQIVGAFVAPNGSTHGMLLTGN